MKILVTGGSGFIGANLVRTLIQKGHEVALILREKSQTWRLKDILDHCAVWSADIRDKRSLVGAIKDFRPEMIFHLAAYGAYPKTQKDLRLMIDTNIIGSVNLMEAAGDTPVINAGTSSEYGIKKGAMKERDICCPDNDYAWSKLCQTQYFQRKKAATLRLFSVYGPWEEPTRLVPVLINSLLKGSPLSLINSVRDYVHVYDITKAFIQASNQYERIKGEIINIGSGRQTSVKQLLGILLGFHPAKLHISWDYEPVQAEPKNWRADAEKAKKVLGWSPRFDLEEGLEKTYTWWKKHWA